MYGMTYTVYKCQMISAVEKRIAGKGGWRAWWRRALFDIGRAGKENSGWHLSRDLKEVREYTIWLLRRAYSRQDSKSQVRETEASLVWSSEPSKQRGEERDRSWGQEMQIK